MGNIIVSVINYQVRLVEGRDLQASPKRCMNCRAVQFTANLSCQLCCGPLTLLGSARDVAATGGISQASSTSTTTRPTSARTRTADRWADDYAAENETPLSVMVEEGPSKDAIEVSEIMTAIEALRDCPWNEDFRKSAVESIQCPVCLEAFVLPITLPCGHSLCSKHEFDLHQKCPICRNMFNVACGQRRPVNDILCQLVQSVQSLKCLGEDTISGNDDGHTHEDTRSVEC